MNNEFLNSINVVRRRAWLIGLLMVVTVATILYLGYTAPASYQARVRLRVLAVESEAVTLFAPSSSLPGREQIINTREEFFSFLRGRNVAWQTIGDLGLTMDADTLQQRMIFEEQDDFVSVVATAQRPDLAEKIATTYVNYALLAYREFRLSPVNQSAQFIDTQLADERQKLNAAQDAFLKFKLANAIESLPAEIQALQGELRRLRLDRDTRHVVGDDVVQLSGELLAFAGLGLLDVADADPGAVADGGAESCREEEERVAGDRVGQGGHVGDEGDGQPREDHEQPANGIPTRPPPEQRIGEDQRGRHARGQGALSARGHPEEVDNDQRAEGHEGCGERVGAPPGEGGDRRERGDEEHGCRRHAVTKDRLVDSPPDEGGDEGPVGCTGRRRVRGSGFDPQ